mmetsp:Transcript_47971/g.108906  ORF Transcript_47971/g.108906 Transcript_47971/m.108906 type:complete len:227 (+) Transcript_47971:716-1396(+)
MGPMCTNSPIESSKVNRCTPFIKVTIKSMALPYMQYPAATISVPGLRMSAADSSPSDVFLKTEKMVPVDTLQSMLEEPSSGSKATHRLPRRCAGTMIGASCSSETSRAHVPELTRALHMISSDSKSSFLTSSPEEFSRPARPYRSEMPALRTARTMNLKESVMAFMKTASSRSLDSLMMKVVTVSTFVSVTSPVARLVPAMPAILYLFCLFSVISRRELPLTEKAA